MAEIFISYRRQQAGQTAASIYNFVAEAFGTKTISIDTAMVNSTVMIEQNLRDAKVMLVLIDKDWLGIKNDGSKSIDEINNVVRAEVSMGLEFARQGRLAVIPVLLDDASMPTSQQLLSDLSDLLGQKSERIHSDPKYFPDDINLLLERIDEKGVPRHRSGRIEKASERLRAYPNIGLIRADLGQTSPPPVGSVSPTMKPPLVSSSKPPTQVAPQGQKQQAKRTDLQTIGGGLIILFAAIVLPTETSMCTTSEFGQRFCQVTVYTYDGVSASFAKTVLFIAAFLCIGWGIYMLRSRSSE